METVKAECSDCSGTGLYSGMCEADGEAVICMRCEGTGCQEIRYKPYRGRRGCRGIHSVYRSRGAFIATGVGKIGEVMSYQEFQKNIAEAPQT